MLDTELNPVPFWLESRADSQIEPAAFAGERETIPVHIANCIREEQRDGMTVMAETPVGRILLKSAPARVLAKDGRYQIEGMAWGPKPIAAVEVKIDTGPWTKATLDASKSDFS